VYGANVRRILDVTANIAIVFLALIMSFVLVKEHLVQRSASHPKPSIIGTRLSVDGVDWSKSNKTVVLAVSEHCRWCAASVPFYQELGRRSSKNFRIVAVLVDPTSADRNFSAVVADFADETIHVPLPKMGINSTPTAMVVDSNGKVIDGWVGMLDKQSQDQLFKAIL
jgi:hypothetical protein